MRSLFGKLERIASGHAGVTSSAGANAPSSSSAPLVPVVDSSSLRGVGVGDAASLRLPLPLLKSLGCNAIRTWGVDQLDDGLLRECEGLGIAVFAGLWIDRLTGDAVQADNVAREAVAQATAWQARSSSIKGWIVGNEVETRSPCNDRLWQLLAGVCSQVRKALPSGVAITAAVAEVGDKAGGKAAALQKHLLDSGAIDFLLINSYGGASSLHARMQQQGFTGKWALGEYGPLGQWESPSEELSFHLPPTASSALVSEAKHQRMAHEQSSTEKAAMALAAASMAAAAAPSFLGGFAFFGGHKREVTDTWYSLALPSSLAASASASAPPAMLVGDRLLAQAMVWGNLAASLPSTLQSASSAGSTALYDASLHRLSSLCDALRLPQCAGVSVDGHPPRALHWKMLHGASFSAQPAPFGAPASSAHVGHTASVHWRLVRVGLGMDSDCLVCGLDSHRGAAATITLPPARFKGEKALYRLQCFVRASPGQGMTSITTTTSAPGRDEEEAAATRALAGAAEAIRPLAVAVGTALILAE